MDFQFRGKALFPFGVRYDKNLALKNNYNKNTNLLILCKPVGNHVTPFQHSKVNFPVIEDFILGNL